MAETTACNISIGDFNFSPPLGCTCPTGGWWSINPPPCPVHNPFGGYQTVTWPSLPPAPNLLAAPEPPRLHPDDIEAIAQRVAKLVRPQRRKRR